MSILQRVHLVVAFSFLQLAFLSSFLLLLPYPFAVAIYDPDSDLRSIPHVGEWISHEYVALALGCLVISFTLSVIGYIRREYSVSRSWINIWPVILALIFSGVSITWNEKSYSSYLLRVLLTSYLFAVVLSLILTSLSVGRRLPSWSLWPTLIGWYILIRLGLFFPADSNVDLLSEIGVAGFSLRKTAFLAGEHWQIVVITQCALVGFSFLYARACESLKMQQILLCSVSLFLCGLGWVLFTSLYLPSRFDLSPFMIDRIKNFGWIIVLSSSAPFIDRLIVHCGDKVNDARTIYAFQRCVDVTRRVFRHSSVHSTACLILWLSLAFMVYPSSFRDLFNPFWGYWSPLEKYDLYISQVFTSSLLYF